MNLRTAPAAPYERGVTIVEVLIAALLIFLALGSVLAMNSRSMQILRSTRQAVAGSQMLQQRIEEVRAKPWPEISNSGALETMMSSPTNSESEMADLGFTETITVSIPPIPGSATNDGTNSFSVQRHLGEATITLDGDLGTQPILMVNVSLQWHEVSGPHQREVRTFICRSGLTRSGIFGSALGHPAGAATPPPAQ